MSAVAGAAGEASTTRRGRGLAPPLLRDAVFRRYWSASTVSMVGDQVTSVAVPLSAVLALHAGAGAMGCSRRSSGCRACCSACTPGPGPTGAAAGGS
jgi:hypothetical protein